MAKFNEGINGPFHGKVGKVVGATRKGISYYACSAQTKYKRPGQNAFEVVADDVVINPALAKLSSGDCLYQQQLK